MELFSEVVISSSSESYVLSGSPSWWMNFERTFFAFSGFCAKKEDVESKNKKKWEQKRVSVRRRQAGSEISQGCAKEDVESKNKNKWEQKRFLSRKEADSDQGGGGGSCIAPFSPLVVEEIDRNVLGVLRVGRKFVAFQDSA